MDVAGCTNPLACNFDDAANVNDGSCDFTSCAGLGCTDANACNYDADAVINDGSCVNAISGFDCDGNCTSDVDGDGVCDQNEVGGCTDMGANNFDPAATDNNGTCTYDADGCTDIYACNFNYQATTDNGTCDFGCYGCMNLNACNFDAEATLHDGEACTFIFNFELEGATDVVLDEATAYSYAFTAGSEYNWTVEGGLVIDGQGTNEVSVVWLLEEGSISVQEVNADGCEGDVVTLLVSGTASGIAEETAVFTAFPNPANDLVTVNTNGFEAHAFQIVDATGRVILSERLVAGRNMINVAHLANGTYQMVLDQKGIRTVKQLVIAH